MVLFDFIPLRVVPPVLFSLISYWMIGLRASMGAWLANLLVRHTAAATSAATAVLVPWLWVCMTLLLLCRACGELHVEAVLCLMGQGCCCCSWPVQVLVLANVAAAALNMSIGEWPRGWVVEWSSG